MNHSTLVIPEISVSVVEVLGRDDELWTHRKSSNTLEWLQIKGVSTLPLIILQVDIPNNSLIFSITPI